MIASGLWQTVDAIGFKAVRVLLSVFLQATVLLGAVGLLTYALRRRRASVRHRLWVAALLITPLLPVVTWFARQAKASQVGIGCCRSIERLVRRRRLGGESLKSQKKRPPRDPRLRRQGKPRRLAIRNRSQRRSLSPNRRNLPL